MVKEIFTCPMHLISCLKYPSAAVVLIIFVSGCSLSEIKQQSEFVEDRAVIQGKIELTSDSTASVHVLLFSRRDEFLVLESKYSIQGEGSYRFNPSPGTYLLAAYQDVNADDRYQRSEPAAIFGGKDVASANNLTVIDNDKINLESLLISQPLVSDSQDDNIAFTVVGDHTGEIVSLNDSRFDPEMGSLGLWKPISFIDKTGSGLYLMQDYDPDLIPVVFIHGAGGGPREFSAMFDALDNTRYQPWMLHYPSGVRLDIVSDYLVKSINKLHGKFRFNQLILVAHSMGGLVMRSAVMKYSVNEKAVPIMLAMSINSPMMGMQSAALGVRSSPIVVPSWRDVAEGSEFIDEIHAWHWPDSIPYHLVFSYESGVGDDGVVALESQIPYGLQSEATRVYGFNSGHTSVLSDPLFVQQFVKILDDSTAGQLGLRDGDE